MPKRIIPTILPPGTNTESQEPETAATGAQLIKITADDSPKDFMLAFKDDALRIIAEKKEEYSKLAIDGVGDKTGYEAVRLAMGEMKNSRLAFASAAEEYISGPMKSIVENVNKTLSSIIDGMKEVETDLRTKKNFIDTEKERLKEEARLAVIKLVQERTIKLVGLGAASDGVVYSFYYDQLLYITAKDVQEYSEEQFESFISSAQEMYDKELLRKQEAEQARIDEENDRLMRINDLEKSEAKQSEENLALRARIGRLRRKEIMLLGAEEEVDTGTFWFPGKPFTFGPTIEAIVDIPDEDWDKLLSEIENYVAPEPEAPLPNPDGEKIEDIRQYPATTDEAFKLSPSTQFDEDIADQGEQWPSEHEMYGDQPETPATDGLVETVLRFFNSEPFTEMELTPTKMMRFYPDEYENASSTGIQVLVDGKIQGLNYIIYPKA